MEAVGIQQLRQTSVIEMSNDMNFHSLHAIVAVSLLIPDRSEWLTVAVSICSAGDEDIGAGPRD